MMTSHIRTEVKTNHHQKTEFILYNNHNDSDDMKMTIVHKCRIRLNYYDQVKYITLRFMTYLWSKFL